MKLHYVRHVHYEGLGRIEAWAKQRGLELSSTKIYDGEVLPPIDSFDFLVVLGGPMSCFEEELYPWLRNEKIWLKECCRQGKRVLGICLGAQLLAEVLGGSVQSGGRKEIGWQRIKKTSEGLKNSYLAELPDEFDVFQWHGDTFQLPSDSQLLLRGEVFENQGFACGDNILALQFHLEFDSSDAERLYGVDSIESLRAKETDACFIQDPREALADRDKFLQTESYLHSILDRFLKPS